MTTKTVVSNEETRKLVSILCDATKVYRKGALVEVHRKGSGNVLETYLYPPTSETISTENHDKIDMIFVDVVVDKKKAETHRQELEGILSHYPQQERLAGGPSYIELAGELRVEQEIALRLMALGESIGMWKVIDAKRFAHASDAEAMALAENGFLMISGWKPKDSSQATESEKRP